MNDVNITSHDQKGGITAQNVNVSEVKNEKKKPKFKVIIGIVAACIAVVSSVVAILTYLGITPFIGG